MKFANLRSFEKHLESASPEHFSDIYMILIKNDYERKNAVDLLLKFLLQNQTHPELSIKPYEGDSLDIDAFISELNAFSFFSQRRILLINQTEKMSKSAYEKLERYFANPSRTAYLVLSAASLNHSTKFYKKAETSAIILEQPEEKPWEKEKMMHEWVALKVKADNKKIDSQAIHYLLKQIGTDQALLHQELEKLFCYIGDRKEITVSDVGAICSCINIENVWQLGEAIFRRDATTALRISKALLEDGVSFLTLLRQIRNQFQTDFQVCSILSRGGTRADITQQFPYMKGTILDRHIQSAQEYGIQRFKQGILKIDEAEFMAKNSMSDHEFLAEMLIIKLIGISS